MLRIDELELGSNDAEDYKRKDNKDFFNTVFLKNSYLEKLLSSNTFFLIGDKGTGKTAYAVFLANNEYKATKSIIKYIRETDYQKFVILKKEKQLPLSDYPAIWRVIILVILASNLKKDDISDKFSKNEKLEKIKSALDYYFHKAFSPELHQAIQVVENSSQIASLIFKAINYQDQESAQITYNETSFQNNLQYIEKILISSIMDIKMNLNQFLFIDGIDIRPEGIDYKEYLMCVKGLAEAVWSLNNDVFAVSNGSKGRFKTVLLLRPDIFQSIGFQNSTNKILNNSVYLDWRITYANYLESELFAIGNKLLTYKQNKDEIHSLSTTIWDYYFSWTKPSTNERREYDTPFIQFLRLSYSRPRDIITIVKFMQEKQKKNHRLGQETFLEEIFDSSDFMNSYSDYLMGEIKDQLAFYYSDDDYQLLLHFLSLFKEHSKFNYEYYCEKYKYFTEYVLNNAKDLPEFIDTKDMFLQFLYDFNIICYIDEYKNKPLYRYCYRERNNSNLTPKIETGIGKYYQFHYGLIKALNLGSYN
jgi:hypothetical protein